MENPSNLNAIAQNVFRSKSTQGNCYKLLNKSQSTNVKKGQDLSSNFQVEKTKDEIKKSSNRSIKFKIKSNKISSKSPQFNT
jgi:hypothetical protein